MYNTPMTWQKLSSKEIYRDNRLWLTKEELLTDHADQISYTVVHKEPGVSIIPFDGEYYYLIRQYRYPVNYTGWEFPAGHLEHQSLKAAALAELEEEVGLKAGKLVKLGSYFEAPGHLDQEIHIYLATNLTRGKQHLEPAEKGIVVKRFTLHEINKLVREGRIKDGLTLTALKYLDLHLNQL